jgi:hypothetical protein
MKKRLNKLGILTIAFGILALIAMMNCKGSSDIQSVAGIGIGSNQKDVVYTADCSGVNCTNTDSSTDGTTSKSCTWQCGNYKGQTKKKVKLSFSKDRSGCWTLSNESIDSGLCQ